jgi:hypothetical protein
MSQVSALRIPAMVATRQRIKRDSVRLVDVWRRASGGEVRVMSLAVRIAAVNSRSVGRDVQTVQGDVAPSFYTTSLSVLVGSTLRPGDEFWDEYVRYRVVSVDMYPHEAQILMRLIQ